MNTPAHVRDADLHRMLGDEETALLVERGLLAAPPTERNTQTPEHPTASWLYRKFKIGGALLKKDEAYKIGNELDRQQARIKQLESLLAESPLPAAEREVEDAIDDALNAEAFPSG